MEQDSLKDEVILTSSLYPEATLLAKTISNNLIDFVQKRFLTINDITRIHNDKQ